MFTLVDSVINFKYFPEFLKFSNKILYVLNAYILIFAAFDDFVQKQNETFFSTMSR